MVRRASGSGRSASRVRGTGCRSGFGLRTIGNLSGIVTIGLNRTAMHRSLDRPNNGLAARMHMHVLHGDPLLTLTAMAV
jgi:hypothetical protein